MYKTEYLPAAMQDLVETAAYISQKLGNPIAAGKLAEKLAEAGEGLASFPYANPVYTPIRPLKHEYRSVLVDHYMMFYRVAEETKTVTVARVIYAGRDHARLLR